MQDPGRRFKVGGDSQQLFKAGMQGGGPFKSEIRTKLPPPPPHSSPSGSYLRTRFSLHLCEKGGDRNKNHEHTGSTH